MLFIDLRQQCCHCSDCESSRSFAVVPLPSLQQLIPARNKEVLSNVELPALNKTSLSCCSCFSVTNAQSCIAIINRD